MHLNLDLQKLIEIIGEGSFAGTLSNDFVSIASLDHATEHDIAIVFDRGDASVFSSIDQEKIKNSQAGLIIAAKAIVPHKNYLIVKDPLEAFQKLVHHGQTQKNIQASTKTTLIPTSTHVAASAVIKSSTTIGENTVVMDQVFIGHDCFIGNNVILYPGVIILDGCSIGDHSIIHAGTIIGSDGFGYQVTKQGLLKIPQIGIVKIGRHVEIGANCTIDRAAFDATIIEDLVKIDNAVHIAHNVKIGAGTAIIAQTGIAGSVVIGKGCQIGGQVAIKDNITIGDGAKIVSKSAVMNNVSSGDTVAGIPAISFIEWKRATILHAKLPELFKQAQTITDVINKKRTSWWQRLFRYLKFS